MTYPLVGSQYASDWPDRYVCHPDWRGFLECKSIHGKLKPAQRRIIQGLRDRDESVWVLRFSVDGSLVRIEWEDFIGDWLRWSQFLEYMNDIERSI